MLWTAGNNLFNSFPIREFRLVSDYEQKTSEFKTKHNQIMQSFHLEDPTKSLYHKLPGTVIIVIGESANRDHMKAFSPKYLQETTPWMSSLRGQSNFYFFSRAYSNFPQTVPALSMYLTGSNQYNQKSLTDTVSIVDAVKTAGYTSWWISNQSRVGIHDTPTTMIAESADNTIWISPSEGDDRRVLDVMQNISPNKNNVIFIHLIGSHLRYVDRTPSDFRTAFLQGTFSEKVYSYDRSIAYTDQLLRDIFQYAKKHLNLQVMVYCADHGEDMEYTHGAGKFTFDMVRIPLFIYLSPEYCTMYPETAATLAKHENYIFTNDLMYDTLCGLLQIPNSEYNAHWDLSNSSYVLTPQTALTKHGEVHVGDDVN